MTGSLDRRLVLLLPALMVVGLLFGVPFAYAVGLSFQPTGAGASWDASYREMMTQSRGGLAFWNSLRLALPTTVIDLTLAAPLAYCLRRPLFGRRLIVNLLVVPMALGPVLMAEGMIQLLGPAGWVNKLLLALHVVSEPVQFVHNYAGVLISLVVSGFPVVFLVVFGYASGLDPTLEAAARVLGAGRLRRLWNVTLPTLAPSLAVASALSFVDAFSVFPTATMVGQPAGDTYVLALAAWEAMYEHYDYSEASAIALTMAVTMLVFVAAVLWVRSLVYRVPREP